ncbi:MAG: lactonase family protein [Chitinophagaceae bacterium]|nr:lactonase family protein [Chitinophagaceae bacterium]
MKYLFSIVLIAIVTLVQAQQNDCYLVVGTYSKPKGEGEGIYVYKFNDLTGTATFINKIETQNPSYLTFSKNEKFVYAVNQNGSGKPNEASAFSFNKQSGQLTFINKQNVQGDGPCYITVDNNNKWLFTANYSSGSVSALPLQQDGSIGEIKQLITHKGSSIVEERQSEPHAHSCVFTPNEKYLMVTDLGTDKIHHYPFAANNDVPLIVDSTKYIQSTPGNGPRHMAFSKKKMYIINELSGTIDLFLQKKKSWFLHSTISTDSSRKLDKGSADIHLSRDGKFLYVTNRGSYNTIATYSINHNGSLNLIQVIPTNGKTPRNFIVTPSNKFVLVANQNSNNIVIYSRDITTGLLTPTRNEIKVGTPVSLQMVLCN